MSKQLVAKNNNENEVVDFLEVTEGKSYEVHTDEFGEYIFDDNSDEHYLKDIKWQEVFEEK